MNRPKRYDGVVIGGGLTGLVMAISLKQAGLSVALIETKAMDSTITPSFDGRVTAIARASRVMLERLKIWQHVKNGAQPISTISVEEAGGVGMIDYEQDHAQGGPMGYIVENRFLRMGMLACLGPGVDIRDQTKAVSFEQTNQEVTITLSDGGVIRTPFCAICEGRHSPSRDLIGIGSRVFDYGQLAFVCTLEHEKPHHGQAIERFFPDGPFAILPMQKNRTSIVWALEMEKAKSVKVLSDGEFEAEILERFGDKLGRLKLAGPRFSYPLSLVISNAYQQGRIFLVGDSLRGIHPIAGQGWNLALRDVAVLSELSAEAITLGLDHGLTCQDRYEELRQADGWAMTFATDTLNRLFSNDIYPIRWAREMGMITVNRLAPLKQSIMRYAMGYVPHTPAIMADHKLPPSPSRQ